jgi:hypothetical protein
MSRPSSYHARRFARRHSSGFAGVQLARLRYLVTCRARHGDDVFSIERVAGSPASGTHVIEWQCRSGRTVLPGVSEQYARRFAWHYFQLFLLPALCDHYAGRGQVAGAPAAVPDVVTQALVRRPQGLPAAGGDQVVSELACEYDAPGGRELPATPPVVCGDCDGAPCYRDGHEYHCAKCGALYNAFGQRLKPRSDWPASARVREPINPPEPAAGGGGRAREPDAGGEIDPGEACAILEEQIQRLENELRWAVAGEKRRHIEHEIAVLKDQLAREHHRAREAWSTDDVEEPPATYEIAETRADYGRVCESARLPPEAGKYGTTPLTLAEQRRRDERRSRAEEEQARENGVSSVNGDAAWTTTDDDEDEKLPF